MLESFRWCNSVYHTYKRAYYGLEALYTHTHTYTRIMPYMNSVVGGVVVMMMMTSTKSTSILSIFVYYNLNGASNKVTL